MNLYNYVKILFFLLLKADVSQYGILEEKREISDFFIFCLDNPIRELLLTIMIKLSKGILF